MDYVRPVLSRWWLVLIVVAIATAGTYVYYDGKPKVFATSTQLYAEPASNTDLILGGGTTYYDPRSNQNQASLLSSGVFTSRVAKKLGRPVGEVGGVSATASEDTDFITITATRGSGREAADIANAYAQAYIEIRSERSKKALEDGLEKSQAQLDRLPPRAANATERATLAANVRRIRLALELPGAQLTQLNPAPVPATPLSPKPKKNASFAFVLSLLAAVILAFSLERFDRRLKRVEDAEAMYGASVLSVIPHAKDPAVLEIAGVTISHDFHEAFRQLRTNVQLASLERPLQRILVTSAVPGEGKSTVARNLAIAFREFGKSVVVVDADLRRPSQEELFGLPPGPGLTAVLTGDVPLSQALVHVPVSSAGLDDLARIEAAAGEDTVVEDVGLALLSAGGTPANPQAILAARRTDEVIAQLGERFDVVIIDTPPVGVVADALALVADSDAVVLVSRLGVSTSDAAKRARAAIDRVPDANVVGVVVNDLTTGFGTGNAYQYGYPAREKEKV